MSCDSKTSGKGLDDDEAKRTLDRLVAEWKKYTYEAEYREFFGGGDARERPSYNLLSKIFSLTYDVEDRLRGDLFRAGPIIELQRRLGGKHKSTTELRNEWIAEARRVMDHEDWHKKGEVGYEEFVKKYCE